MTDAEYIEALLEKWIPYCNGFPPHDPELKIDRSYFQLEYARIDVNQEMEYTGGRMIVAYLPVVDELGNMSIMGIFEKNEHGNEELIYASSLVDTDWSEFYAGVFPTGLIDQTKPYLREDKFLNTD